MPRTIPWIFFALSTAIIGCVTADDAQNEDNVSNDESTDSIQNEVTTSNYFIVTAQDYRKCAFPACGGVYVAQVNKATTKCSDGSYRAQCYIAETDLSSLGLNDGEVSDFRSRFTGQTAIVRGYIKNQYYGSSKYGKLVVNEAWQGRAETEPTGIFYRVKLNGVKCIASPCPSFTEEKLNSTTKRSIAGVDLYHLPVSQDAFDDASEAFTSPDGLLVVGKHKTVTGPGGSLWQLKATEFYTRVVHTDAEGQACAGFLGTPCPTGYVCDITIENACQGADLPGQCHALPEVCAEIYQPVCGCDGQTYANDCSRQIAGVQIDHQGECCVPKESAMTYWSSIASGDANGILSYFATEAEATSYVDPELHSVYWVAPEGESDSDAHFVAGANDLWWERFDVSKSTCKVTITGEH